MVRDVHFKMLFPLLLAQLAGIGGLLCTGFIPAQALVPVLNAPELLLHMVPISNSMQAQHTLSMLGEHCKVVKVIT